MAENKSNLSEPQSESVLEEKHFLLIRIAALAVLAAVLVSNRGFFISYFNRGFLLSYFAAEESKPAEKSLLALLPLCANAQSVMVTDKEPQMVAVHKDCAQAEISWDKNFELKITEIGKEKYYIYDCGKLLGVYSPADLTRAPGNTLRIAGDEGIVRLRLVKAVL